MFEKPSLLTRIIVGEGVGGLIGLMGLIFMPYFYPDGDWLLRWGVFLWYATVGCVIGAYGVLAGHPKLGPPLPWWIRSPVIGAWMNFVLVFFAWDMMAKFLLAMFGAGGFMQSPFWFVLEGAVVGLVIDFFATRYGGEGAETAGK